MIFVGIMYIIILNPLTDGVSDKPGYRGLNWNQDTGLNWEFKIYKGTYV